MVYLAMDTTSAAWRQLTEYARARIALLTDACTALDTPDEQRRQHAARIAELRELLAAPGVAREMAEHMQTQARSTY